MIASRRLLLSKAWFLGLGALPWPVIASASDVAFGEGSPTVFTAYRNGSRLGFHRIDYSKDEDRLIADIEIAFDVKLAFIPVYRYRHRNREVWQAGQLISLETETDDNGEDHKVSAVRKEGRILVDGSEGRLDLPGDSQTTSYWNEASIERGQWIDTQSGKLVRSAVTKKPPEPVLVEGRNLEATRYDLDGDITCNLWYTDGRWVKLLFVTEDGSEIEYTIDASQQAG
ncbi:MAG: DUF6134 family protein [Geminicoccaceae bacterium]